MRKIFFKIFARFRNKSLWSHYEKLKYNESLEKDEILEIQQKKLFELIKFAKKHSPYWTSLLKDLDFDSEIFLEEFKKIPIQDKNLYLKNKSSIISNYKFSKIFYAKTSGTSGVRLNFPKNEEWDSFTRAAVFQGYSWHGVSPWDFNIYFWGIIPNFLPKLKIRFLDALQFRFRVFLIKKSSLFMIFNLSNKIKYIEGYSSMVYNFAKMVRDNKKEYLFKNLKLVKGTSETIHQSYKNLIKDVFKLNFISEYGAAESGVIAFGCKNDKMHLNSEGVFVEIDENNEIIVTNLVSKSFPVIRYKLGDFVEIDNEKCDCGLPSPVLKSVSGRSGKLVYGRRNKYPSLVFYNIFKNIYSNYDIDFSYQVIQNTKGELLYHIEDESNDKNKNYIIKESKSFFKDDINIKVVFVEKIKVYNEKRKDFISNI
jgi:phenylacetate-CoA ligase